MVEGARRVADLFAEEVRRRFGRGEVRVGFAGAFAGVLGGGLDVGLARGVHGGEVGGGAFGAHFGLGGLVVDGGG